MTIRRWQASELDTRRFYEVLRLRVDVFVVEQACPYAELDGRDLEPGAVHYLLTEIGEALVGTVRLLREPAGGYRVGRLCTARSARGRGFGRLLMQAVTADVGDAEVALDAQQHLGDFYRGFGFEAVGPAYDWDGVAHLPMRRPGRC